MYRWMVLLQLGSSHIGLAYLVISTPTCLDLVETGGARLAMLFETLLVYPMGGDHYWMGIREENVRLNIRGTRDEISILKGLDICSVVASSFYNEALASFSGGISNVDIWYY
jgi:hypothetical protein